MSNPLTTLVVGLGGSGAWTAAHVKRQLFDAYNNAMPPNVDIVVFDTTTNKGNVGVGGVDIEREPGMGYGRVIIDDSEYSHIGGDAYELVQDVASTKEFPHMSSWLLASYYLENLPRAMFHLDKGAGQFRQLGRLALFNDVLAPDNSRLRQMLENKITRLVDKGSGNVNVMVIGSLAGGTGAGLFLDVPFLAKRVAESVQAQVKIRGFFYLPGAFAKTLDAGQLNQAKGRSFAALRELKRFLMSQDYKYGYPMYYHSAFAGGDQHLWHSKLTEKLFDYVYLVDGAGETNINNVELKNGASSVVADTIVSYIDEHYGSYQEDYDANIQARVSNRQTAVGRQAFVSSVGSYSYILPIQQIIEGWSFRLCQELIERVVPGETSSGTQLTRLSATANPEVTASDPLVEVEKIMTTNVPMLRQLPGGGTKEINPLPLWKEVYGFSDLYRQKGDRANEEVRRQPATYWTRALVPQGLQADPQVQDAINDTKAVLTDAVANRVKTSDQRENGNPNEDWRDINRRAEAWLDKLLGRVEPGGGRAGGEYREALDTFVTLQRERFTEYMSVYIENTLNGAASSRNAIAAKTGRLGWLIALMDTYEAVFGRVADMMEGVRTGRESSGTDRRAGVEKMVEAANQEMREKAGQTKLMGKNPYLQTQEDYLAAVQTYADFHKTEMLRDAVARAVVAIRADIQALQKELAEWADALALDRESLYGRLQGGANRIRNERDAMNRTIRNHTVLNDPEWEEERFKNYVERKDAMNRIFNAFTWQLELEDDGRGGQQMKVNLMMDGQPLTKRKRGEWSKRNIEALLGFARAYFQEASQEENIISYLMEGTFADNPEQLAEELAREAGHTLTVNNTDRAGTVYGAILLASEDATREGQAQFIDRMMTRLAAKMDLGKNDEEQSSPLLKKLRCDNPYRLTLLSTGELIPLEGIRGYTEAISRYLQNARDARQLTHIFPAEVRAVHYETQLERLDQAERVLQDRVALLLEDETRFKQFLMLMAYRLIYRARKEVDGVQRVHWVLETRRNEKEQPGEWWLTMPGKEASLLEAMITYVILEKDVRAFQPGSKTAKAIPYPETMRYFAEVRWNDTQQRMERGALAIVDDGNGNYSFDEELRYWVEDFMVPVDEDGNAREDWWTDADRAEFDEIATLTVQHDILNDLRARLHGLIPAQQEKVAEIEKSGIRGGQAYDAKLTAQEVLDLYSIAVLSLMEECEALRRNIQQRYNTRNDIRDYDG